MRGPIDGAREAPALHSVTSGFFTNALNPSLAAFYFVLVPQFIPREAPFARSALTLSAIHVGLAFPWHSTWAIAGSTLARVLASGAPRRALDVVTGSRCSGSPPRSWGRMPAMRIGPWLCLTLVVTVQAAPRCRQTASPRRRLVQGQHPHPHERERR